MNSASKRAVAATTAQKNDHYSLSYWIQPGTSRVDLKEQLGVLLLHLQAPLPPNHRERYWGVFEKTLRHYVDLKVQGVLP